MRELPFYRSGFKRAKGNAGNSGKHKGPRLWAPTQLGSDLLVWLKGDSLSGGDGSKVATWGDSSGNARNFTQATEAKKPTLQTAELNSLNVVGFEFDNKELLGGPSLSGIATSASLFHVSKGVSDPSAANGIGGPVYFGTATVSGTNHLPFTDGSIYNGDLSNARKTVGNSATSLAQWNILSVSSATNDWKYYINGTQFFTTATNTFAIATEPCVGRGERLGSAGDAHWDGMIAEVILANTVLSAGDRQKIEGYLAHKWALTGNLDAGHPYKTTPP